MPQWSLYNAGRVVPVARYTSACKIAWRIWEQRLVAVCGVIPIAAIVPVFLSIVRIPALQRDSTIEGSLLYLVLYTSVPRSLCADMHAFRAGIPFGGTNYLELV